jgi:hypothetical protein
LPLRASPSAVKNTSKTPLNTGPNYGTVSTEPKAERQLRLGLAALSSFTLLVIVSTEPNYATIYINGRETAKGKADFYIFKNEKKTIKVVADGYDTYSKQFDFNDFNLQQESVHVTLESNIH